MRTTLFNHSKETVKNADLKDLADAIKQCKYTDTVEKYRDWLAYGNRAERPSYQSGIPEADCMKWMLSTMGLYAEESRVSKRITNVYGPAKGGFRLSPTVGKKQKLAWQLKDFLDRHLTRMGIPYIHRNNGNFYRVFRIQSL